MPRFARCLLPVLVAGSMLAFASCSRHSDHPRVYPVTGKVLYQGRSADGAQVTFVPVEDDGSKAPRPGAIVKSDGSFRLSTYVSHDGAPEGRYAVTIVYRSPQVKENDENRGPDLLRGRYADPKTTPLKVDIKREINNLEPFQVE